MHIEKCALCGGEAYANWFAGKVRCMTTECWLYTIPLPTCLWNFIQQAVREKRERER
jgi:hypothetical protein